MSARRATPEARPVWPNRAMRDYLATIAEVHDDYALRELVKEWDASPADPFRAARAALSHPDWDNDPLEVNEHVRAVLVALGFPDGSPRQESPTGDEGSRWGRNARPAPPPPAPEGFGVPEIRNPKSSR